MRYRVRKETEMFVPYDDFQFELKGYAPSKYNLFPKNFEWRYTFSQMYKDFKMLMFFYLYKFTFEKLLPFLGFSVSLHDSCKSMFVDYVELDFDNIKDLIFTKLTEYQKMQLYHQRVMIIVGRNIIKEFDSLNSPYSFFIYPEYGMVESNMHGRKIELNGYKYVEHITAQVPVYFLPDIEGILIIPDLTDTHMHLKNTANRYEKTSYIENDFYNDFLVRPKMGKSHDYNW